MTQAITRAERTRLKLLDAASAALVAGDGACELQDVALRAGLSVGLVSHHFGSKAGLISAVVHVFYDQAEGALDLSDFPRKGWGAREQERLSRLIDFLYREKLAVIILSKLAHYPEVAAVEAQRWRGLIVAAARNIIKGQARGQIADSHRPTILAAMIVGAARHAIAQALASTPRPTKADLVAIIWAFIISGLRLSPASTSVLPLPPKSKGISSKHGDRS